MMALVQAQKKSAASQSAPQKKNTSEEALIRLEREWVEALKKQDKSALDQILSDDFIFFSPTSKGELRKKSEYIENRAAIKAESVTFENILVRVYGNTAVVNGSIIETSQGQDRRYINLTDIWVKKANNWQAVSRHTSLFSK